MNIQPIGHGSFDRLSGAGQAGAAGPSDGAKFKEAFLDAMQHNSASQASGAAQSASSPDGVPSPAFAELRHLDAALEQLARTTAELTSIERRSSGLVI